MIAMWIQEWLEERFEQRDASDNRHWFHPSPQHWKAKPRQLRCRELSVGYRTGHGTADPRTLVSAIDVDEASAQLPVRVSSWGLKDPQPSPLIEKEPNMLAWQFAGVDEPLVRRELPIPNPEPGEVLIEIRASGLCHTDVGIMHDKTWLPQIAPLPLTLGHEVAGTIASLGEGVENFAIGDRVGVSPAGRSRPGLGRDGGYASHCTSLVEDLIPIPEEVSYELAALGTDAGRASYRAVVKRGGAKAGDKVGIIGLGGLGQIGAKIAATLGAEVYVVDVKEELQTLATELGATGFSHDIRDFAEKDLDLIVDFAGFGETTSAALEAIRPFGRVVQVGMAKLESTISTAELIFKQAELIGSRGGTTQDIADLYQMFADGDINPNFERIAFSEIPEGLERLRAGQVNGRLIAIN